ncbi:hypothetical protein TWF481_003161 [Arthrobotrys musiformis]|uniref:Uncharacterized protein n=1 Tax=Arthrobotrys musiformis TaxID=47236 RepID=A0AAV9VQG8_9PEZI
MAEVDHKLYLAGIPDGFTFTITEVMPIGREDDGGYSWKTAFKCANGQRVDRTHSWRGSHFEVSPKTNDGYIGCSVLRTPEARFAPKYGMRSYIQIRFKITGKHTPPEAEQVDLDAKVIKGTIMIYMAIVGDSVASVITYTLDGGDPILALIDINGNDKPPAEGVYAPDLYFVFGVTALGGMVRVGLNATVKEGGRPGARDLDSLLGNIDGKFWDAGGDNCYGISEVSV